MSYHARITMPLLIVTGCIGACGKTNRIGTSGRSSSPTIGTKSLPSAPRPCSQITLVAGRGAVSISIASRTSLTRRASCLGSLRGLRPECLHDRFASLDVRAADQVDAIRDGGKDSRHEGLAAVAFHALERLADRLRLPGQIDDERALPDHGDLTRQDRRRHEPQAHLSHLLAEPRHHLVRDGERRLRRDVARGRTGSARRQHEVAPLRVSEFDERPLDRRLLVGDQALDALPLGGERAAEPFLERGEALVFVDAGRRAVADRDEPDLERAIRCGHARLYRRRRRGGVADHAEQLPELAWLPAGEPLLPRLPYERAQPLQIGARMRAGKLRERRVVVEEPLAPALGVVVRGRRFPGLAVPDLEARADRRRVDLAHQPADVLQLTALPLAAADALRLGHRGGERLGELDQRELVRVERHEPLAERLEGKHLLLALRLAWCVVGHRCIDRGPYNSAPLRARRTAPASPCPIHASPTRSTRCARSSPTRSSSPATAGRATPKPKSRRATGRASRCVAARSRRSSTTATRASA